MKHVAKIILIVLLTTFSYVEFSADIANGYNGERILSITNLDTGTFTEGDDRNDKLDNLGQSESGFINSQNSGDQGIYDIMFNIAHGLKNIFFAIATIFLLVLVFRILFSENTEEENAKFKKGVLWITIGIIIMQFAFLIISTLYDQGVGETLANNLANNVIEPLIQLIEMLAAFFFIVMAIIAFYKMVVANGDDEAAKNGRMTILYAIIGFIVVKFARDLVSAVYTKTGGGDLAGVNDIIITIINWMNGFVGIIVIIMIIYSGAQVLLSAGDEETLGKAKKSILYIVIGIGVLILNYLILTFFI